MRRAARLCVMVLALVALILPPSISAAQNRAPQIETGVSAQEVEAQRPFTLQISAMVAANDGVPGQPGLKIPPGIVVRSGPTLSSKTHVTLNGHNLIQQVGIVASWTLEASKPGVYRIGPPSVEWDGRRYSGSVVEVRAVRAGSLPNRRSRDPFDLFDLFDFPQLPGFDHPGRMPEPSPPPSDPTLAMTDAPDPVLFIRAVTDKQNAVLGEQLTLSIYEYRKISSVGRIEMHEPSAPDFVQFPVLDPTDEPPARYAEVDGSTWSVRLLRQIALFALRTGELTIQPMRVRYVGPGLRGQSARESRPVTIRVVDAPREGRPVGFRPGDVGAFSISAHVEPRTIDAGGAVSVRVKVEGTGNLPMTLPTPSSKGVEWLDPEVSENIEADSGTLRGERVFTYVVRLDEAGTVELGEIRLPYYDPHRRAYEQARAQLGTVTVRERTKAQPKIPKRDRFAALGGPRQSLGYAPTRGQYITDSIYYWIALIASPFTVGLVGAGASAARRIRRSVRSWRDSLERHAQTALQEAKRAKDKRDVPGATAAIERAVHAAIEVASGVKSRGLLRVELSDRLRDRGLEESVAVSCVDVLATCESLRFDPSMDEARVDAFVTDAEKLIKALLKTRNGGK